MTSSAKHDTFRRIIQAAQIIKNKSCFGVAVELGAPQTIPLHPSWNVLPAALTPSSNIVDALVEDGIPLYVAQKLSAKLNKAEDALRNQLESSFRETWQKILQTPSHDFSLGLDKLESQLLDTYKAMYMSKSSEWAKDVRDLALKRMPKARAESFPTQNGVDAYGGPRDTASTSQCAIPFNCVCRFLLLLLSSLIDYSPRIMSRYLRNILQSIRTPVTWIKTSLRKNLV